MSKNTKNPCVYCGAAPVNHTFEYISNCMTIVMNTVFPSFPQRINRMMSRILTPVIEFVERLTIRCLAKIGIVTFSHDVLTHRTQAIRDEAKNRGIAIETIRMFGKLLEYSRFKIPGQKKWTYFESIPIPQYIYNTVDVWVDNKNTFNKKFTEAKLPVVKSTLAWNSKQANTSFAKLNKPVITKPQYGSRARHTTVDIIEKNEYIQAFKRAQILCPSVVVEEFKRGTLYRATCIDKKIIGVVEFIKPSVVADGIMTVSELLTYHNNHKKFENLTDVKNDAWFIDTIHHQGLTVESIPEKGRMILLSEHSERPNGGYFIDVTDTIPKENRDIIEHAARVTELDVIGFDIISMDLSKPHSVEPFVFIEGNSLPFIELHMEVYEGTKRNTASAVWDLWTKK